MIIFLGKGEILAASDSPVQSCCARRLHRLRRFVGIGADELISPHRAEAEEVARKPN